MDSYLRTRASRNFEKYLQDLLNNNETTGLPAERLSESEWKQLNNSLQSIGVKLVPHEQNGILYYWFTKINKTATVDKTTTFKRGTENVFNYLLNKIRSKYQNLSDETIIEMIKTRGEDIYEIYYDLRHKRNGEYNGVSQSEYENAFIYALQSAGNKNALIQLPFRHNWNPQKYENTSVLNMSLHRQKWQEVGRNISMNGSQHWTWFRSCAGNTLPKVKDPKHPRGFHIGVNANITRDLLMALDDILIDDGGRYIYAYKFPKTDWYDKEVKTRHDPITIYMNARNPEIERRIINAVRPFARSNEGLVGEMLGYGVALAEETSGDGSNVSVGEQIAIDIANMIAKYKDRI